MTTKEKNLGKTLRSAREAAGLTVDDAVYLGKIPRGVVIALEEQKLEFFSSPLYARSFLRQYGEYVGADIDIWIADLVPPTGIDGETVVAVVDMPRPNAARLINNETQYARGAPAVLWMLLITAGLFWGVMTIYQDFEESLSNGHAVREIPELGNNPEAIELGHAEFRGGNEAAAHRIIPVQEYYASNSNTDPEPPLRAIVVPVAE